MTDKKTAAQPWDLLGRLQSLDPGRPRLTWYDDQPGPTQGERIELSARVLANWVSKAGNLLQDDLAAGPGTRVWLDLPAHWRAVYWALAAWSVGATVVLTDGSAGPDDPDIVITDDPATAAAGGRDAILVSLPALARAHPEASAAPGAIDEARELGAHGDRFTPMQEAGGTEVALSAGASWAAYGNLVVLQEDWGAAPRIALQGDLADVLQRTLSAYAADGSVVLTRGATDDAERLRAEGITRDLR